MIRRLAPAKLNLTLAILGGRPDGFHELQSWVSPIDLADVLTVEAADSFSLSIEMSDADPHGPGQNPAPGEASPLPTGSGNLIYRAAHALAQAAGRSPGTRIELIKRIPVGGGLGGGSSDAAATLMALNELWALNWSRERLAELGATLGSDVPFFLTGGQAIMRGRGEQLERVDGWGGFAAVIVPPFGLATADVYRRYSQRAAVRHSADDDNQDVEEPWRALAANADRLLPMLYNDLEPAAFEIEPRLVKLQEGLTQAGGRIVRMTGSGSCLFTLFEGEAEARSWVDRVAPQLGGGERAVVARVVG